MNERIKQLAREAGMIYGQGNLDDFDMLTHMPKEVRFAELIVAECGVALSPMLRDMVSRGQAYDLIKQHFGVEE